MAIRAGSIEFCRKNGTPEPEFCEYAGGFAVVFPFKEPMNTEATVQSNLNHIRLTSRQEEIISILKRNTELSGTQIHEQLSVKIPMRTLQYELNKLKKLGLVSSQGHAKSFVWSLIT